MVAKGEMVVQLDTSELSYQLASLRGQLESIKGQRTQAFQLQPAAQVVSQQLLVEQAREQLAATKAEEARAESLFREGALSQKEGEQAANAVVQAELLVSQQEQGLALLKEQAVPPAGTEQYFGGLIQSLEGQIAILRYQLSQARLRAPISGLVRQVLISEGAVAMPGTPLVTVFQPDYYQVEVYLPVLNTLRISPGMTVGAVLDDPAEQHTFQGEVKKVAAAEERISPLGIVEQRIKTTIQLAGQLEKLRPGTALEVTFTTRQEEGRLVVPKTTLFPHGDGEALFVIRDGRAEIQIVKRGFETEEETVITDGLQPGDKVIRNPRLEGLAPGRRVAVW